MGNISKTGFSLVELVIVISILVILSSIAILSYDSSLLDTRNSRRVTDISNLKVSLQNHKLKQGSYPIPGDMITILNNGLSIIKQGYMDDQVITKEIVNKPIDPLSKGNYMYSITANKQKFQIAMSIEDDSLETDAGMRAFVDGDYQNSTDNIVPSIVFATQTGGELSTLNNTIIIDKGTYNIPYDSEGNVVTTATDLDQVVGETGVNIPNFYGYYSCVEIYENGAYMGTGSYYMLDENANVIKNDCDGDNIVILSAPIENSCAAQPAYTHAVFTTGTPTSVDQAWQNTNGGNPCYYECNHGYTGSDCNTVQTPYLTCTAAGQIKYIIGGVSLTSDTGLTCNDDILVCSASGTGYTISACNAGATVVYTNQTFSSDTVTRTGGINAWAGGMYQWGNKTDLSTASTTSTKPTCTDNSTFSGTLFVSGNADWCSARNDNVWGGISGTNLDRTGPCKHGYYVPTQTEWQNIVTAGGWSSASWSDDGDRMKVALKMPFAGYRGRSTGTYNAQGITGEYCSSTPDTITTTNNFKIQFNSGSINPSYSSARAPGCSVRCMKIIY